MKKLLLIISVVCAIVGCKSDDADHRPGLWCDSEIIETFRGDTVRIVGQASNYIGLDRVEITCAAWNINKVYNLNGKQTKVFDYDYRFVVPADALFDQQLLITVVDTEGTESKKTIVLTSQPDGEAPHFSKRLSPAIYIEAAAGAAASYTIDLEVADNQMLKHAIINVAGISASGGDTIALSGNKAKLKYTAVFNAQGSYPTTITLEDMNGEKQTYSTVLNVTAQLSTKTPEDYKQLYLVPAGENATDYMFGFYRYCPRQTEYQYGSTWNENEEKFSGFAFYAEANAQIYFLTGATADADTLGTAPGAAAALTGQVVMSTTAAPITIPTAGYYSLLVNLESKAYILEPYTVPASTYSGKMKVTGAGFKSGDWNMSAPFMESAGTPYRNKGKMTLKGGYQNEWGNSYCICDGTWDYVFRYSDNSDYGPQWWVDPKAEVGSAPFSKVDEDTKVEIVFDAAEMWSTMKIVAGGGDESETWFVTGDFNEWSTAQTFTPVSTGSKVLVLSGFSVKAEAINQWGGFNLQIIQGDWTTTYTVREEINTLGKEYTIEDKSTPSAWGNIYCTCIVADKTYKLTLDTENMKLKIEEEN